MIGIAVCMGTLGLILGSFVNALVWRLHEQELVLEGIVVKRKKDAAPLSEKDLSVLQGRSMCPLCHHRLAAVDLIPLLSWLLLKGRCRYCHAPISWQYPSVELLTGLLFVASYIWWPDTMTGVGAFSFGVWLLFLTGFMALAVYDLKWFLLPDRIVFPLMALAFAWVAVDGIFLTNGWVLVAHACAAAVCLSGVFFLLHTLSRGTWIGFGDVKLAVILGLLAGGMSHVILLLFGAALLGTVVAVPLLVRGKANAKTPLPFGPFLLASTYITVLFGERIVAWYLGLFGLR